MNRIAAPVTLRPARPNEAEALARLHVAVWRATYRDYAPAEAVAILDEARRLPYWMDVLSSDDPQTGAIVAARANDTLAGVISFAPSKYEAFAGRTEIKHLYVDRDAQGQGIGRRLLNAVLDRAQYRPGTGIALAVVRQNEGARAFYRSMGGLEVGAFVDPGPLWKSENIVVAWDRLGRSDQSD